MRHRLLLTIGVILAVCQLISVFWLWHESQERYSCWSPAPSKGTNNQKHIEHEVREAAASLLIPTLRLLAWRCIFPCWRLKITRPLSRLQRAESRTPDNLQPITLKVGS